jgi:hypothetical protein
VSIDKIADRLGLYPDDSACWAVDWARLKHRLHLVEKSRVRSARIVDMDCLHTACAPLLRRRVLKRAGGRGIGFWLLSCPLPARISLRSAVPMFDLVGCAIDVP